NCRFCDVAHGTPDPLDFDEPKRVADAVEFLGLKYAVVTSVTRDDLPDGGAEIFAKTIEAVHALPTGCAIEVLIPDLLGDFDSLKVVVDAKPEVLNHNVETVERCYPFVRPQAVYRRSLDLLANVKKIDPHMRTKSGLMVGVGETWDELMGTMRDLRSVDCDVLTVGQYLAPSANHVPIDRYYTPEEFDRIKEEGLNMGFKFVESGALVRSSYHAARQLEDN
ncbi:MAG: lipoyl synthase, partial [Abditibacteriota bacterium]|nr:lipoyl synthase [Abditibacteriota bacterium]